MKEMIYFSEFHQIIYQNCKMKKPKGIAKNYKNIKKEEINIVEIS
jgi:hypothetical protein